MEIVVEPINALVVFLLFLIVIRLYKDTLDEIGDFVGEILAQVFIFICKWVFKPIFLLLAYPIVLVIWIVKLIKTAYFEPDYESEKQCKD